MTNDVAAVRTAIEAINTDADISLFETVWGQIALAVDNQTMAGVTEEAFNHCVAADGFLPYCISRLEVAPVVLLLNTRKNLGIQSPLDTDCLKTHAAYRNVKSSVSIRNLDTCFSWKKPQSKRLEKYETSTYCFKQTLLFQMRRFEAMVSNFFKYNATNSNLQHARLSLFQIIEYRSRISIEEERLHFDKDCLLPCVKFYLKNKTDKLPGEWSRAFLLMAAAQNDIEAVEALMPIVGVRWEYYYASGYLSLIKKKAGDIDQISLKMLEEFNKSIKEGSNIDLPMGPNGKEVGDLFHSDLAGMQTIESLYKIFEGDHLQPFLMSGTLLGWARDRRLISFDKDLDFGMVVEPGDLMRAVEKIERSDSYCILINNQANLGLRDKKTGIGIDIFWFKESRDKFSHDVTLGPVNLKFEYDKFDLKHVKFKQVDVVIPIQWSRFLEQNFGAGWKVPDPNFISLIECPAMTNKFSAEYNFFLLTTLINESLKNGYKKVNYIVSFILNNRDRFPAPLVALVHGLDRNKLTEAA